MKPSRLAVPVTTSVLLACGAVAATYIATSSASASNVPPPAADPAARQETDSLVAANPYLSRAQSVLVDRCMRDEGFSYPLEKPGQAVKRDRTYGLSVEEAQRTGYQSESQILTLPDREPAIAPTDPTGRTRYYTALFGRGDAAAVQVTDPLTGASVGTSPTGCNSQAQKELFGGDLAAAILHTTVTGDLVPVAEASAAKDRALTALNKRWARCMAQAGWHYPDPDHALGAARRTGYRALDGGQPREIAIADATCEEQTDYAAGREAVEEHHLRMLLDRNPATIAAVRKSGAAAMQRARAVLRDA
jgi:hypothetical protein